METDLAGRVILVQHDDGPADDRVSTWLTAHGYEPVYRRPYAGEQLGLPDGGVVGSVVYGGGFEAYATDRFPFLKDEARWIEACMARGIPLLGICQGAQQISLALGGEVGPPADGACEFGYYAIEPTAAGRAILPAALHVTQVHYHTFSIPQGAEHLASSALFANQAFRYGDTTYAFQFHAEVTADGFRRVRERVPALHDRPGAQARADQDALMPASDAAQHAWFMGFLDGFLGGREA